MSYDFIPYLFPSPDARGPLSVYQTSAEESDIRGKW